MLSASDEEHIAFAKKEQRVLFTQDEDFLRLHSKGVEHCGLVFAHQRTPVGDVNSWVDAHLPSTRLQRHAKSC